MIAPCLLPTAHRAPPVAQLPAARRAVAPVTLDVTVLALPAHSLSAPTGLAHSLAAVCLFEILWPTAARLGRRGRFGKGDRLPLANAC
jgi:hypothetical protein